MAEEIAFENGRISNFQGLVTLTLTLDRVILHTIVHHSSTSTYMPNFIEIKETFCGRTDVLPVVPDGRTDGHLRPTFLGRLRRVDLIKRHHNAKFCAAQSHSGRDIAVLRIFKDDILWIKQRKNRFFYLVPGREQNLGWPSLKKKTKTTREWHFPSLPGRSHWDGRFELGHITDLNTYATFRDSKFRGFGVMYDTLNFVILHRNSWSHLKTV